MYFYAIQIWYIDTLLRRIDTHYTRTFADYRTRKRFRQYAKYKLLYDFYETLDDWQP